jgi:hypothetical protein
VSRRKRKPIAPIRPVEPEPLDGESTPDETLPQSPLDRRLAIASVVIRNMIGVAGVLFLGWSAQTLIVLYFFDTLGGMLSVFAGLMASYFSSTRSSPFDRLYNLLTALALGAFTAAFMAIPLGMPVLILMMSTSWSFKQALTEPGFVLGVVSILGTAMLSTIYWWMRVDSEGQRGERALKREFTLIFGRWLVVIFAVFTPLVIFVAAAPVILVIVYAVVTTYTELYPDRFTRFFDKVGAK